MSGSLHSYTADCTKPGFTEEEEGEEEEIGNVCQTASFILF